MWFFMAVAEEATPPVMELTEVIQDRLLPRHCQLLQVRLFLTPLAQVVLHLVEMVELQHSQARQAQ
jgi:hypothetical protein